MMFPIVQIPVCDSPIIPAYEDAFTLGFANFTLPPLQGEHQQWDSCHRYKGRFLFRF
jgi:hypothetical protein